MAMLDEAQLHEFAREEQQKDILNLTVRPTHKSYLSAPKYCPLTSTIAICLTFITVGQIIYFCNILNFQNSMAEAGLVLKVVLELAFLTLCTAAVWKHSQIQN